MSSAIPYVGLIKEASVEAKRKIPLWILICLLLMIAYAVMKIFNFSPYKLISNKVTSATNLDARVKIGGKTTELPSGGTLKWGDLLSPVHLIGHLK